VGGGGNAGNGGVGRVAVAVVVSVVVPDRDFDPVVDLAVAIVVDPVAQFFGVRVDVWIGVIAVGVVADVIRRLETRAEHRLGVAEAVVVGIEVPGGCIESIVVDLTIAVVVDPVAEFVGVRVDAGIGVVAVVREFEAVTIGIHRWRGGETAGEEDGEKQEADEHGSGLSTGEGRSVFVLLKVAGFGGIVKMASSSIPHPLFDYDTLTPSPSIRHPIPHPLTPSPKHTGLLSVRGRGD